ncbi:hypothetical protein Pmar_PMAR019602 [Perkinsus marinus ATCC 50983]|uniref:Uncharacterized protein n=1 Tax=Perkinsus marinus (strain ATCC 50983 / TXsc) TaxID=423536 RepID=C5LGJ8_PERM5|nr:hypothetical protein Pmar_PMAR019602 [Perkinsus marinus ATCC 50983]EER04184.1 hypothetical protein Pmar_PMAR019602 [Perkinsus marinus ATCC 50983]|eukprot:XP_002772368.1 hypothetical protein Pmar_PMAR019602 [Perkinsus marinus ATCC 50983]
MGTWIANWRLDKVPVGASRLLAWSKIAAPVAAANKRMSIREAAEGSVVAGTRFPSAGDDAIAVVDEVACHPTDSSILAVTGEGIFKLYRSVYERVS